MTDLEHKFDHWCTKGLTAYELEGIRQLRKMYGMYGSCTVGTFTSIEAAEAKLLKLYGHLEDEACAAFPVSESWVAAVAEARAWSQSQPVSAEKLSDQQGEQT